MDIYELLQKYPGLYIEMSYLKDLMVYNIRLRYGPYNDRYLIMREGIEHFKDSIFISIIQDFYRKNNIEVHK